MENYHVKLCTKIEKNTIQRKIELPNARLILYDLINGYTVDYHDFFLGLSDQYFF